MDSRHTKVRQFTNGGYSVEVWKRSNDYAIVHDDQIYVIVPRLGRGDAPLILAENIARAISRGRL